MLTTKDLHAFEVLTFDCYGTLIDWEAGLLTGLREALGQDARALDDDELLERYAVIEAEVEAGPYLPYREVLGQAVRRLADELAAPLTDERARAFGGSVTDWPPFADSAPALAGLARNYALGVITNCDDDLFAASAARLGNPFAWVVTAQQARSYKPGRRGFELAIERSGVEPARILHVAQSLYHDHVPAKAMGLTTAWINRRHGRAGSGATPPAGPVEPDLVVADMAAFARLALAGDGPPAGG